MSAEATPLVVRSQSASHPLWLRLRSAFHRLNQMKKRLTHYRRK